MANELDSKSINHSELPLWAEFVETPDGDTLVQPRSGFVFQVPTSVAHALLADEAEAAAAGSALRGELDAVEALVEANGITFEVVDMGNFAPGSINIGAIPIGSTVLRRVFGRSTGTATLTFLLPAGGTYRTWYAATNGFGSAQTNAAMNSLRSWATRGLGTEPGGDPVMAALSASVNDYFTAIMLISRVS